MILRTLVFRYALFAFFATVANLMAQRAIFGLVIVVLVAAALCTGTMVGLVLKYFLDKYWIFKDLSSSLKRAW